MSSGIIMGSGDGAYDADAAQAYLDAVEDARRYMEPLRESMAEAKRDAMQQLKEHAEAQPKGATVECPTCLTAFVKKHPRQAFCNKDGKHRCKDQYHNMVDPKRRARAERWMNR